MKIFTTAVAFCLISAGMANAELILKQTQVDLSDSVVQVTVWAEGTEGEVVNTFSNMALTPGRSNIHQVYNVGLGGPGASPDAASHDGPGWGAGNEAWDTYFMLGPDYAFSNTSVKEEVGDSTTTGLIPLAVDTIFGMDVQSGFNQGLAMDPIDGAVTLLPEDASTEVAFLQVVLPKGGSALLDVRVDSPTGNGHVLEASGYLVGIPEPASFGLLSIAGLFGFRRRR